MSGRHRAAPRRHREPRPARSRVGVPLVALAVAVVAVAGFTGARRLTGAEPATRCSTAPLRVVAAPEIADVVAEVARGLVPAPSGSCPAVTVASMTSAAAEHSVAATAGSAMDVWVPESTQWLLTARGDSARPGTLPEAGPSVARSPVVLALPRAAARALGASEGPLSWAKAAAAATSPSAPVQVGLPTPEAYPASTSTLLALRQLAGAGVAGRDRLVALMRQVRQHVPGDAEALLEIVASSGTAKPMLAAPVSEQSLWAFNSHTPADARVAASYVEGAPSLDYPFVVLTHDARAGALAGRLHARLVGPDGSRALQAHGFRTATGVGGSTITTALGLDPDQPARGELAESALVGETVKTFDAVTMDSRMLAVLDVSGSMGVRVPGAGAATRMDVTRQAALRALALYPPSSQIGLWEFSTQLTPSTDYHRLAPVARLDSPSGAGTQRQALAAALTGVQPIYGGATGLYDTTLAAVREVRSGWQAGYENSVVLFTDGRNEDGASISLDELLRTLRKESDPKRPVPVYAIGFGPDIDLPALRAIAAATGGKAYEAANPAEIQTVLLDAISTRACRPDC